MPYAAGAAIQTNSARHSAAPHRYVPSAPTKRAGFGSAIVGQASRPITSRQRHAVAATISVRIARDGSCTEVEKQHREKRRVFGRVAVRAHDLVQPVRGIGRTPGTGGAPEARDGHDGGEQQQPRMAVQTSATGWIGMGLPAKAEMRRIAMIVPVTDTRDHHGNPQHRRAPDTILRSGSDPTVAPPHRTKPVHCRRLPAVRACPPTHPSTRTCRHETRKRYACDACTIATQRGLQRVAGMRVASTHLGSERPWQPAAEDYTNPNGVRPARLQETPP